MLHVILCDDDERVLVQYGARVEALAQGHALEVKVSRFPSGEALLFALEDPCFEADILYLDVQMRGMNGIETARRLRLLGCRAQLVFLTNSRDYVFDSFDARPLQYLLKGDSADKKFEEVFLQAAGLCKHREDALFDCERGAERRTIPIREIAYFEVAKRIVTVHYDGGVFEFYSSMGELEARLLSRGFVRCHRAFLVSVARIRRLGQECIGLTSGEEIPLGRTHARGVKETLSQYLSGNVGKKVGM